MPGLLPGFSPPLMVSVLPVPIFTSPSPESVWLAAMVYDDFAVRSNVPGEPLVPRLIFVLAREPVLPSTKVPEEVMVVVPV